MAGWLRRTSNNQILRALPRPYIVAIWGAILAAFFSVVLNHWNVKQSPLAQRSIRQSTYLLFIERLNPKEAPQLSSLLNLGRQAPEVVTDGEIQNFEDRAEELLKHQGLTDIQWQFDALSTPLRICSSDAVRQIIEGIDKTLRLRDDDIDWATYGIALASRHESIRIAQETGSAYAYEERINPDERLMIFSIGMLGEALFNQLTLELNSDAIRNC